MRHHKDIQRETNITDTQFLVHYLFKEKLAVEDYEAFCVSIQTQSLSFDSSCNLIWASYCIDVLPYMYVLSRLTSKQFFDLLIFFNHYLSKSQISSELVTQYIVAMYDKVHTSEKLDIDAISMGMDIVQEDNLIMLCFLYTMQYFFL